MGKRAKAPKTAPVDAPIAPRSELAIASVLVSAFLLFLVQPMTAKQLLPAVGGSPAVWGACLVFFQAALLAGYVYADVASTRLSPRTHAVVHGLLVLAPFVLLPPRPSIELQPGDSLVSWRVILVLAASAGPAFAVLATNASLVQRWAAMRGDPTPYGLYAASNVGSLVALVAYPFVVEPFVGLHAQSILFTAGYAVFAALTLAQLPFFFSRRAPAPLPPAERSPILPALTRESLRWLLLALCPSFALVAGTQWITQDVGGHPLFWNIPLAAYLATFVLGFLKGGPFPRTFLRRATLVCVAGAIYAWIAFDLPYLGSLILTTGAIFFGGWACHATLAREAPPSKRVTEFYLWIAIGGLAGGVLATLLAPLVLRSLAEFPIALFALAAMTVGSDVREIRTELKRATGILATTAVAIALGLSFAAVHDRIHPLALWELVPFVLVAAVGFSRKPSRALPGLALATLYAISGLPLGDMVLHSHRSFFGVLRVVESNGVRRLVHGNTTHGAERTSPASAVPGFYYHPDGPLGAAMLGQPDDARIGVVGLGTGALAVHAKPTQKILFFEIDPSVEPIARQWFRFLEEAKAPVFVMPGDARPSIRQAPPESLDVLIVDAFSSDSVPVHLLTQEAVGEYLRTIKPSGFLMLHLSNRYLDLEPVVTAAARAHDVPAFGLRYHPDELAQRELATASYVVVLTTSPANISALVRARWEKLSGRQVLWTDDKSSILPLLSREMLTAD